MQDYLQGSDEYNAYKNELSSIVLEMRNAGMVALDQNGNQTDIPVDQINVAAIKLPDIVVSGGNINIEADKLQGTGSMTAQGAPQLTINNSSDLYLAVGDLTIKDAGGQLKFNGSDLKSTSSGNNFTGTTKADGLGTDAPTITVNSNRLRHLLVIRHRRQISVFSAILPIRPATSKSIMIITMYWYRGISAGAISHYPPSTGR